MEQALLRHPAVAEIAAIGVPSELGEDDVMVCVVAKPGEVVEIVPFMDFCRERLPYFAVPRYVDVCAELPKNAVGRVLKHELRARGVTGAHVAKRLIAGADAVVENFSPRVMEAFGLGHDVLHEVNPPAVVVRMPAFGLDGPWRDRVGFAPTMEQLSGMAWMTGYADGAPMAPRGACDPLSGIHAAFALVAALEQRDRTGEGSLIELPMIEVALNVTAE